MVETKTVVIVAIVIAILALGLATAGLNAKPKIQQGVFTCAIPTSNVGGVDDQTCTINFPKSFAHTPVINFIQTHPAVSYWENSLPLILPYNTSWVLPTTCNPTNNVTEFPFTVCGGQENGSYGGSASATQCGKTQCYGTTYQTQVNLEGAYAVQLVLEYQGNVSTLPGSHALVRAEWSNGITQTGYLGSPCVNGSGAFGIDRGWCPLTTGVHVDGSSGICLRGTQDPIPGSGIIFGCQGVQAPTNTCPNAIAQGDPVSVFTCLTNSTLNFVQAGNTGWANCPFNWVLNQNPPNPSHTCSTILPINTGDVKSNMVWVRLSALPDLVGGSTSLGGQLRILNAWLNVIYNQTAKIILFTISASQVVIDEYWEHGPVAYGVTDFNIQWQAEDPQCFPATNIGAGWGQITNQCFNF